MKTSKKTSLKKSELLIETTMIQATTSTMSNISSVSSISMISGVELNEENALLQNSVQTLCLSTGQESFNFKSETKFVNIAKLIQANKTLELLKLLQTNSMNPNQRDETGATCSWTPLYWSVKFNKIECVEILLHHGADANLVVNDPLECYGTALDLATLLGHEEIECVIRKFMNKEGDNRSAFKAVRTKLRGNAPAFNFKSQKRQEAEMQEIEDARRVKKQAQDEQAQQQLAA